MVQSCRESRNEKEWKSRVVARKLEAWRLERDSRFNSRQAKVRVETTVQVSNDSESSVGRSCKAIRESFAARVARSGGKATVSYCSLSMYTGHYVHPPAVQKLAGARACTRTRKRVNAHAGMDVEA